MAVLLAESFHWQSAFVAQQFKQFGTITSTGLSFSTTFTPFDAEQSVRAATTSGTTWQAGPFSSAYSEMYGSVRVRSSAFITTTVSIFGFSKTNISDTLTQVRVLNDGTQGDIFLTNGANTVLGTAENAVNEDAWFLVELRSEVVDTSNGNAQVYIDGTEVIDYTGDVQGASSSTTMDFVFLRVDQADATQQSFISEFIITDGERIGPARFLSRVVNGDTAQADWTPSSGATQFGAVDNKPTTNEAGTYLSSSTAGHKSRMTLQAPPYVPATTYAVALVFAARATTSGTMRCNLKVGSTTQNGTTRTLGTSTTHDVWREIFNTNPDTGLAWTPEDIDALSTTPLEAEIEVVTVSGEIRVSTVGVEYIGTTQAWVGGDAASTLPAVTVSAEGEVTGSGVTGEADISLQPVAVSGSGIASTTGTGAVSLEAVTVSATGVASTAITGTSEVTLQSVTVSAEGIASTEITGTAEIGLEAVTVSAEGEALAEVTGTAAVVLQPITVSASGNATTAITGTAEVALQAVTVSGSGIASTEITGTSEVDLSAVTVTASGAVAEQAQAPQGGAYGAYWDRPKWKKRKEEIREAILEALEGKPVEEVVETPPEEIAETILDPRFRLPIRRFVTPDLTPVLLNEIAAIQSQLARMAEDDDEEAILMMALAA